MDLTIPGLILFEGGLSSRWEGARRAIEDRARADLWRRCEAVERLVDLPGYLVRFREGHTGVVCVAELQVNGARIRCVGVGADPLASLEAALARAPNPAANPGANSGANSGTRRGEFCPATWGELPTRRLRLVV